MLTIEDIKGYNLFAGLNEKELLVIAKLCNRETYEANTVLFDPDNTTSDILLLEGGNDSIQIEVPISSGGTKIVIHILSKGETFGWASLSPVHIRTAQARTIEKATVIRIDSKQLTQLLEENNHMGYLVMRNLSGIISSRLSYTTVAFRHEIQKMRKRAAILS